MTSPYPNPRNPAEVAATNEHVYQTTNREYARARYAWPGGYELYAILEDGAVLCAPCVLEEEEEVFAADRDAQWTIAGWDHAGNLDEPVHCDHCARVVE